MFEEGVGPIPVTILADESGQPTEVWMQQPLPQFLDIRDDRSAIAEVLSLSEADLAGRVCRSRSSASGLPFLYVVVKSLAAMKRVSLSSRQMAYTPGGEQRRSDLCDHDRYRVRRLHRAQPDVRAGTRHYRRSGYGLRQRSTGRVLTKVWLGPIGRNGQRTRHRNGPTQLHQYPRRARRADAFSVCCSRWRLRLCRLRHTRHRVDWRNLQILLE